MTRYPPYVCLQGKAQDYNSYCMLGEAFMQIQVRAVPLSACSAFIFTHCLHVTVYLHTVYLHTVYLHTLFTRDTGLHGSFLASAYCPVFAMSG